MTTHNLSGKVALIQGGSRGIGAAIVKRLAAQGAAVAFTYVSSAAKAEELQNSVISEGGKALAIRADSADADAIRNAVNATVDAFGRLDILVNNAGVLRDNLLFKMSSSDWDTVMGVHLRGAFLWSRAAQAQMVPEKWGKIVNLSSTSALGNRGQANYSAAKAGMQGFTKSLAIELGPFGINVNAVAPGFIATDMTRATAERTGNDFEQMQKAAAERIPVRRVGRPEDIANVVSFLVSEDASYVSGQTIYVAGGPKG